jgi:hypothetical protein
MSEQGSLVLASGPDELAAFIIPKSASVLEDMEGN